MGMPICERRGGQRELRGEASQSVNPRVRSPVGAIEAGGLTRVRFSGLDTVFPRGRPPRSNAGSDWPVFGRM